MAAHSIILAWRIPWTEEPGGHSPWGCRELDTTEQLTRTHLREVKGFFRSYRAGSEATEGRTGQLLLSALCGLVWAQPSGRGARVWQPCGATTGLEPKPFQACDVRLGVWSSSQHCAGRAILLASGETLHSPTHGLSTPSNLQNRVDFLHLTASSWPSGGNAVDDNEVCHKQVGIASRMACWLRNKGPEGPKLCILFVEIDTGYLRIWLLWGRGPGVLGGWQTRLHSMPFCLSECVVYRVG